MHAFIKNHKQVLLIIFLMLIGGFLRFYNLDWGSPFYFHPDERQNIAYPVLASKSLFMLDQQNFDTGTFPLLIIKIILSFFTKTLHIFLSLDQLQLTIFISRVISALISLGILILLFFIVKKIFNTAKAFLALAFAAFSIGFIQFSHFGTIELWEALLFLLLFFYSWRISKYAHKVDGVICGVLLGFALTTKILSIILIPAILLSFFLFIYHRHFSKNNLLLNVKKVLAVFFLFIFSAGIAFTITSLPLIRNFPTANNSIRFESDVALGKVPVFYTQGFTNTIPVIFQFTKVYPFLLNPLITLLFIPSLFSVIFWGIKNKNYAYLLLTTYYLLLFMTQSFFFAKWTRYMIPTLPFVYIIIGVAIDDWLRNIEKRIGNTKIFFHTLVTIPIVISFIFAAAFFDTVYLQYPTPIKASTFAANSMPQNAKVITEPFDLGITPFHRFLSNITFFNFYDMEDIHNPVSSLTQLEALLASSDYIILPSQRILASRLNNRKIFPLGYTLYSKLLNGQLGFKLVYETPCDIFCKITYLGSPVFSFEETANVFDRPTIFIFKKN